MNVGYGRFSLAVLGCEIFAWIVNKSWLARIRVKTVAPNGTITDYPFPGYEVENPTGSPTVRITFSIAGQAVALKVIGSSTNTYYLYNDHLGSTATMSTTSGGTVTGSTAPAAARSSLSLSLGPVS